ncbi:MAG: class I SAM-dependent methyltransferase [Candidatus Acidiferrales bacterium]
MVPLAEEILKTGRVKTVDGRKTVRVQSETSPTICEFLKTLVVETTARVTLEVGLAFGVSALFICEGLREAGGQRHIAIDPNQTTQYQGIGIENARRAGFGDLVELREEASYVVLPELLASGVELDFAYIDGWHTLDYALVDFFYVDLMLKVGGIVAMDDCYFNGVHPVCRYIATNRAYRVRGVVEDHAPWRPSSVSRAIRWCAARSAAVRRVTRSTFNQPDEQLGFTPFTRCVAFEKIGEDTRTWDEHHEF